MICTLLTIKLKTPLTYGLLAFRLVTVQIVAIPPSENNVFRLQNKRNENIPISHTPRVTQNDA